MGEKKCENPHVVSVYGAMNFRWEKAFRVSTSVLWYWVIPDDPIGEDCDSHTGRFFHLCLTSFWLVCWFEFAQERDLGAERGHLKSLQVSLKRHLQEGCLASFDYWIKSVYSDYLFLCRDKQGHLGPLSPT